MIPVQPEQTKENCLDAITKNYKVYLFVKKELKDDEDICAKTVEINGLMIKYMDYPSSNVCMKAVTQNGMAIKYIKIPKVEHCIIAMGNENFYEEKENYPLHDVRRIEFINNLKLKSFFDEKFKNNL